ncbi:MAG TPA: TonB-dependent receptor [Rhizomicrobium sp.]|jgi:iron complex outermembrane receptor protein
MPRVCFATALGVLVLASLPARAGTASIETVEVTATRLPEPVGDVPADVTLIAGDELRARQATSLGTALDLTAGVEAPAGGDAGPSSAVPSFWGLHEFDAFLLVVDDVPWGGAFNPAIPSLDFNDVQRIEVLKGSAPAVYGATSFVGVIHLIHYPAGEAANDIEASYGSYGSWRAATSFALPEWGNYKQSLAVDAEELGFADKRESVRDQHLLYRGESALGPGTFRIDADISLVHDVPPSPIVRSGDALTKLTPINANYNPANGRIDENRYHADIGYSLPTGFGTWETLLSFANSSTRDIRGFLRSDLIDDGSENADSQDQHRLIEDGYFDTHITHALAENADLVFGTDLLFGLGRQRSVNGAYYVPLSGLVVALPTTSLHVDEINTIRDKRLFGGQYAEVDWHPASAWDVTAGLRLNETYENKASVHIDGFDPAADENARAKGNQTRLSGSVGASYQAWKDSDGEAVLYADYRNAFKPAAIDFGPDYTPDVLNPETAQSYEVGVKGGLLGGDLSYQLEAFLLDFSNLVVSETDSSGAPVLRNAGGERLKGIEFDARYQLAPDLSLAGNFAYHDARFTKFILDEGGPPEDLGGNQLTLAPHILAAAGLLYAPPQGFYGNVVANYVGRRYLDEENEAPAASYITLNAVLGYRFGRYDVSIAATNLTDRRPPVTQSEFGDSSYYLLPARTVFVSLKRAL